MSIVSCIQITKKSTGFNISSFVQKYYLYLTQTGNVSLLFFINSHPRHCFKMVCGGADLTWTGSLSDSVLHSSVTELPVVSHVVDSPCTTAPGIQLWCCPCLHFMTGNAGSTGINISVTLLIVNLWNQRSMEHSTVNIGHSTAPLQQAISIYLEHFFKPKS